jgi:hypothetical protein
MTSLDEFPVGNAHRDIKLPELALEAFFPADPETGGILRQSTK